MGCVMLLPTCCCCCMLNWCDSHKLDASCTCSKSPACSTHCMVALVTLLLDVAKSSVCCMLAPATRRVIKSEQGSSAPLLRFMGIYMHQLILISKHGLTVCRRGSAMPGSSLLCFLSELQRFLQSGMTASSAMQSWLNVHQHSTQVRHPSWLDLA